MRTEKYYAIRIGDPRRHQPYLMLSDDRTFGMVPILFTTRKQAESQLPKSNKAARVVRASINYGGSSQEETK